MGQNFPNTGAKISTSDTNGIQRMHDSLEINKDARISMDINECQWISMVLISISVGGSLASSTKAQEWFTNPKTLGV